MMKTILYSILIFGLFSCNESAEKKVPIDKITYEMCVSLKQNDKEKFKSYFDVSTLNGLSISEFDYVFNNAVAVANKYELPSFELWKENWIFFENDSVNNIVRVGLPFIRKPTTANPESYFKISYNAEQKFIGFTLQNVTSDNLPDRMFPNKKDKFEFSENDLVDIRIYFLPGQNSEAKQSKSMEFKETELNTQIKADFKKILELINSAEIISAEKGAVHEQTNTNDLKAIVFKFKDGNEVLTLSVLNPTKLDKYVEVNTFYVINAAILYQLSDRDKTEIQEQLNQFVSKYIK